MPDRDLHSRDSYTAPARNHPFALALGAAAAGVSLGAFVAIQWFESPPSSAVGANEMSMIAEPARLAETTGLGSHEDRRASPKCEQQTWPYKSRDCLVRGQPRVRVIPADKVDTATIRAIETPVTAEEKPVDRSAAEPATRSHASLESPQTAPTRATQPAVQVPRPAPLAKTDSPAETPAAQQPASQREAAAATSKSKRSRHARDRRKDEQKLLAQKQQLQARQQPDEVDDSDGDEPRRSGHWTRRAYDVPADDGFGRRQVYVIRRAPPGGPIGGIFGGLFGGGGWSD
jgi:hypothetical protein